MVDEFKNAMLTSGIVCREDIIADGQIHRFANHGKGQKDGWYVYHDMAGAFGDWSQNIQGKWSAYQERGAVQDRDSLNRQIAETSRIAETETTQKQAEAARTALEKWNSFSETGSSPYLATKNVDPFGVRFEGDSLVIPLRDGAGKLWSLQKITSSGSKRFLPGGRKKGCFHLIGNLTEGQPIIITEGYATGASIHMATGHPTVVAFDAGNLEPVVAELKKVYPKSQIILAGDDDRWGTINTGREKVEEVAQQYACSFVFPEFKNMETKPTDFNDLHVLEGIDVVKAQLQQVKSAFVWREPRPLQDIREELLPVPALAPDLIPEPFQEWLMDIAERMQCPLDYVTIGAMIMIAAVVGAGCGIRPKRQDSWTVIPNLWGGIVGAPSTLKSPALKEILKPLETLEDEAWEVYEKSTKHYQVELEAYKTNKEVIKKELFKAAQASDTFGQEAAKEKLRNLKEPLEPSCKRYITNDATIEKMHELLSRNPRGLLLFRDELLGLLTSWDREGYESDRAFYLEAWNGYGSKTTDRIGARHDPLQECVPLPSWKHSTFKASRLFPEIS